jgi:hypothetical protein
MGGCCCDVQGRVMMNNRYSSAEQQVLEWCSDSPFKIKKRVREISALGKHF